MPVIKVWCLPKTLEEQLQVLCKKLIGATLGVPELSLAQESDVTVLFPVDMMEFRLGNEIIIEVIGLYIRAERTEAVRNQLASALGLVVQESYPHAKKVECFIHPFNPTKGFWSSDMTQSSPESIKKPRILTCPPDIYKGVSWFGHYEITECDARQLALTEVSLDTIDFVGFPALTSLKQVREDLRSRESILLGARFAYALRENDWALKHLLLRGIRSISFLGTNLTSKSTQSDVYYVRLVHIRYKSRKQWKTFFGDYEGHTVGGSKVATLPPG